MSAGSTVGTTALNAQTISPPSETLHGTAVQLAGANAFVSSFMGRQPVSGVGGKIAGWGTQLKKMSPAALISGIVGAPTQYAADKASKRYKDDKKFDAGHFVEQAVPAAATAYLAGGMSSNFMTHAGKLGNGTFGVKDFIKNTVHPTAIHAGFKREADSIKNSFNTAKGASFGGRFKAMGRGLLGVGLLGLDLIPSGQYLSKAWGKNEEKKTGGSMVKTAGMVGRWRTARNSAREARDMLKKQHSSGVHRPDLIMGLKAKIKKEDNKAMGEVARGVGGVAVTGVVANKTYNLAKEKIRESKQNLGIRGTEYAGLIA